MRLRNLEEPMIPTESMHSDEISEQKYNDAHPHLLDAEVEGNKYEKYEAYEKLCDGKPDAFYILGAGFKEWKEGRFKSMGFGDIDYEGKGSLSGGKSRNVAAAQLYKYFPESKVVANSGSPEEPVYGADVFAKELKHMGVEPEDVIIQRDSYSTFTELLELIKMIVDKNVVQKHSENLDKETEKKSEKNWSHVAVVTSEYQIPRAKAMLDHIYTMNDKDGYRAKPEIAKALLVYGDLVKDNKIKITFVPAEAVLILRSERYRKFINDLQETEEYKKRVASEERGTAQILDGTYGMPKKS